MQRRLVRFRLACRTHGRSSTDPSPPLTVCAGSDPAAVLVKGEDPLQRLRDRRRRSLSDPGGPEHQREQDRADRRDPQTPSPAAPHYRNLLLNQTYDPDNRTRRTRRPRPGDLLRATHHDRRTRSTAAPESVVNDRGQGVRDQLWTYSSSDERLAVNQECLQWAEQPLGAS